MRKMELLRLRVKDLNFEYRNIFVRDGKGNEDRVVTYCSPITAHNRHSPVSRSDQYQSTVIHIPK